MILNSSVLKLARLLKKKEISSLDLVQESIKNITSHDSELNSFISVRNQAELEEAAKKSDNERNANSPLLWGLPYSLKDAYVTKELVTTAGSKVLNSFKSPYDATVHHKIKEAGAILIGKNSQDAWGHGGSSENTDFGIAKNPWNTQHVAGGSSGGSAASVSSRMVAFAIGEDTGGSIRNPSSHCNISGLKVTYGRVSRYGSIAYASSLDTVGPMAKSVEDIAVILGEIAGPDVLDASSSHQPVENYLAHLEKPLKGLKVGLPKEFFGEGLDPEIKRAVLIAAKVLEEQGAILLEVSIPYLKYSIPIYYMIANSETSSNLARYDGIRYGSDRSNFTAETARRIMLGTYALSAGYSDKLYKKAQKARTMLIKECSEALELCDVLVGPITPTPAPKIGDLINDPLQNMLGDLFTTAVNVVGVPSLAVPVGFTKNSLPMGMQIIGNKFKESQILSVGHQYQLLTDWHVKYPKEKA